MPISLQLRGAMLGRLLDGRYRIVRVLGSGGFGQTYVAEDTKRPGNPSCVLKHLSFSSQDPAILRQVRRMFFAEAETLENLGRHDQIPQLLAYFEENEEFYLVQEYIQGHPLSEEFATGRRLTEDQVIELLEDVLQVLEFVHAQQVIHRDLKPENLIRRDRDQKLVLIDFGAVKTIENSLSDSNSATQLSVPVYTSGYAASEQCLGQPRYNSDLYSLGMIAIQALTGVRPAQLDRDPRTGEPIWRDKTAISDDLASVLELLTKFHFADRYQTAKQVLEALVQVRSASSITQAPLSRLSKFDVLRSSITHTQQQTQQQTDFPAGRRFKLAAIGLATVAVVGGTAWAVMQNRSPELDSPSIIPSPAIPLISSGKTLISSPPTLPSKQAGIDQFRQGNFKEAVRLLKQARQKNKSDPETLIYLNNAQIGDEKAHTIAVVLPVRTQPTPAFEVLRGIAQAQDQINQTQGINGIKLRVAIASDDSKSDQAKQIAQALVDDPTIVGVVGHGTSDITFETGEIYQTGGLPVISPLSSANELSKFHSTVFRTMPNDQLLAKNLATYLQSRLKKRKAAIFFNQKSLYSASLRNAFKSALYLGDRGQTVEELDLGNPAFNGAESVDRAIKKGAEVLLLTPNSDVFDRSLLAINANRKRLPLLAGDTLYSPRILSEMGMAANGMVVAVPAVRTQLGNSPFEKQARSLWGKPAEWRAVMGYDAAQALIAALQKAQTRNGVRSVLATPDFAAVGAVQTIKFTPDGDREMEIALMRVTPTKSGQFEFRPVSK